MAITETKITVDGTKYLVTKAVADNIKALLPTFEAQPLPNFEAAMTKIANILNDRELKEKAKILAIGKVFLNL